MVACCGRPSPPCPGTAGTEWRAVEAGCVEARGPSWRSGGGGARPHGRAARGPPLLARTRRVSSLIVTCGGSAERYIFQKNNRVATGTGTARAPPARVGCGYATGVRVPPRGARWRLAVARFDGPDDAVRLVPSSVSRLGAQVRPGGWKPGPGWIDALYTHGPGRRRTDFWITVSPPVRRRPQAA